MIYSRWLGTLLQPVLFVAMVHFGFATRARAEGTIEAHRQAARSLALKTLEQPRYSHAHWGYLFVDASTGETLLEERSEKLFAPASVTKLYTTSALLDAYGPDHRWETRIVRSAEIDQEGNLMGDLVLIASGDPFLGSRGLDPDRVAMEPIDHTYGNWTVATLTAPDPLEGIRSLARDVFDSGIRKISGDVLIDDRLFDHGVGTGSGPTRLTPIMLNDNCLDIVLSPTEVGKPAKLEWRPKVSIYEVKSEVVTSASAGKASIEFETPKPGVVLLKGVIPMDAAPLVRIHEVDDPAKLARSALIDALTTLGVSVSPGSENPRHSRSTDVKAWSVVAKLQSQPLSEDVKLILKTSHNLQAGIALMHIAIKNGKRDMESGLFAERAFLSRLGVPIETLSLSDGSGGSASNFVTPKATVQLLSAMRNSPFADVFRTSLPIMGVDGTLVTTVSADSPIRGKVLAKTGTYVRDNYLLDEGLLAAKALAGYMETSSGRKVDFAIMINHVLLHDGLTPAQVGKDLAAVCEAIYVSF